MKIIRHSIRVDPRNTKPNGQHIRQHQQKTATTTAPTKQLNSKQPIHPQPIRRELTKQSNPTTTAAATPATTAPKQPAPDLTNIFAKRRVARQHEQAI